MLASPLYMQSLEDCKSSRIPTAPGKPAAMIQERASAKRTQADHSRRESLMSKSSQEPRVSEKPTAMFSSGHKEPGNQLKSSIFKHADPSNLGRSLVEGNKDRLLSQARSDQMKQEHQVGSLNNCISELQQRTHAQRLELLDAQHGFFESRREQVRLQEELSLKEKVLRDTQIRSMQLKNYELPESQCKIKEKTMRQYKSSLLSCRKCKIR